MSDSTILWAFGFVAFYLVTIVVGVRLTLSYTRAGRNIDDHIARFHRDADIDDAADMATDGDS